MAPVCGIMSLLMRRHRVDSSVIAGIGYDEATGVLEVKFRSGSIYDYFGVPAATIRELLTADSLGKYFNEQIRGHFPEKRVRHVRRTTLPPAEVPRRR
jgi:KTSC domain